MREIIIVAFILIFSLLTEAQDQKWSIQAMQPNSKNILLPKKFQRIFETTYINRYKEKFPEEVETRTESDILETMNKSYLEVDVRVESRSELTLTADTLFQSVRGGGTFDLEDIVVLNKGSFYLSFSVNDPDAKIQGAEDFDIYYWSYHPPLEIDGVRFGQKCGTLLKLDPENFDKDSAFHLNATGSRYKPVINGTYYFVRYDIPRLVVATIQIGDAPRDSECLSL